MYQRDWSIQGEVCKIVALPWPELAEKFKKFVIANSVLGLDVETTAITDTGAFDPDARLRMVQLGSRREAWCIDPHDEFWRPLLVRALSRPQTRYVSHTNYDVLWTHREFGVELGQRSIDLYPMAALLYPGEQADKDLKALSAQHIDGGLRAAETVLHERFRELAPVGERVGAKLKSWGFTNIPLDDPAFATYGGLDAIYARRLLDILAALLKRARQAKLSRREQRISRMATAMQERGLRVDREYTEELLAEVDGQWRVHEDHLRETFGFSPRSPKRAEWLAERGAKFTKVTPKGQPQLTMPSASSPGTLPDLAAKYADDDVLGPVFAEMIELASRSNLRTNLQSVLEHLDPHGFVHPRINTQAAVTGRMSIVHPAMQTFKKRDGRLRGCFISRDGYVLVGADYDSQEIRLGASFSKDKALRKIVRDGLNQHAETAAMIFGARYVDKTSVANPRTGQTLYDQAKTLDFAQQYGAGPKRIAEQLGITKREATALWRAWRHAYAGLVAWTERMGQASTVINPWGRRIPADPWRSYANGNYAIQSSGRDVLGDAMCALEDAGWADTLWLPVHDELILQVPEDEAEEAAAALEACMYTKVGDIELTATAKILGTRWSPVKSEVAESAA